MQRKIGKMKLAIVLFLLVLPVLASCKKGKSKEIEIKQEQQQIEAVKESVDSIATLDMKTTKEGTTFIYGDSLQKKTAEKMSHQINQLPFPTFWGGEAYSILTPEGDLYLIDGGFRGEDGNRIASYVKKHGGKVKGWILTHPHVDHIGAFLDYMEKYSDNVDTVYFSPFTKSFFEEEKDPEIYKILNDPDALLFYEFLKIKEKTEKTTKYIPLKQGDQIEIGDILLECHSSFEPEHRDVNGNSLVMTLSYDDFCFALTTDMTEKTLLNMVEKLDSNSVFWDTDILQIPHHGYMAGITSDFLYQKTSPEYVLLDCTKEEYEKNSVNIKNHVQMIEDLGIKVVKRFDGTRGNKILIYAHGNRS